jgi:hypothetical protein
MISKPKFLAGAFASGLLCAVVFACSSSKNSAPTSSSSAPEDTTQVVDAGLVGPCSPFYTGCYQFNGSGAYTHPAVTATCASPGGPNTSGPADTHCVGVTPQTVNPASCSVEDAGPDDAGPDDAGPAEDAGAVDAAPVSDDAGLEGQCGANGPDYGATMWGTSGKDDDCKYQVEYTSAPICENDGTYFVVTANYLTRDNAPVTGACTYAELCLNNTHPAPEIDSPPPAGEQKVVEGPPGTYTIGPVQFDAPGIWTVRFHFNEICCDVANDSPHGHAAFYVNVP